MHGDLQVVESEPLFYKIRKEDFCVLSTEAGRDSTDSLRKFKLHLLGRERESQAGPVTGQEGLVSRQTSTDLAI